MNKKLCPICKEENFCQGNIDCWCKDYTIPSIIFYLLEDEDSCLCKNCIEYFIRKGKNFNMLEDIFTRRSIRKFTGEVVDEKDLKLILKAGFQAPSAHNLEPRDFIVVKDKKILEKIAEVHKYGKMIPNAGCAIIVCGDTEVQKSQGLLVADCSASLENMLLAAHSLKLGGVWNAIHPIEKLEKQIREILNIPETILPIGIAVIGPTDVEARVIDRYNEEKIHKDKW